MNLKFPNWGGGGSGPFPLSFCSANVSKPDVTFANVMINTESQEKHIQDSITFQDYDYRLTTKM